MDFRKFPRVFWRLIRIPQLLYAVGLGPLIGSFVLLLTTKGRKSGRPRVVPLQYEEDQGVLYIGSARGTKADWFCNILANPEVEVQVGSRRYHGVAQPLGDAASIADFLEMKLKHRPRMMRVLLRMEGVTGDINRMELEALSEQITAVSIHLLEPKP